MEDKVEREGIILGELVGIIQCVLIIFIHSVTSSSQITPTLQALLTGAKVWSSPPPALPSLASQEAIFLKESFFISPTHPSNPASYMSHSAHKLSYSLNFSGTPKHRLHFLSENQEVTNHPPGRTSLSVGPPYWSKKWGPFSTCLTFSSKQSGKFPAARLL